MNGFDVKKRSIFIPKTVYPILLLAELMSANSDA